MAGRRQQKVLDWTQRQIYLAAEALLVELKAKETASTPPPPEPPATEPLAGAVADNSVFQETSA
jgi:hypothetical protein